MKKLFALAAIPAMILATAASANSWEATSTLSRATADLQRIGDADGSAQLDVVIGLKLRNKAELDQYVARQADPNDMMFRQSLSSDFVHQEFDPAEADIAAVKQHLASHGCTNIEAAGLLVTASCSIDNAREAFNTDFALFSKNGVMGYANTKPASVPSELHGIVESVLGLEQFNVAHTMIAHADAQSEAASSGFSPAAFPTAYGATTSTSKGTSTVIGIITSGTMTTIESNLSTFESKNKITAVPVKVEGAGSSGRMPAGSADEWDLDSQDIVGMSGGVKQLIFYSSKGLTDSGLTADYNLVVSDNTAKGINVSLGEC